MGFIQRSYELKSDEQEQGTAFAGKGII